MGHALFLLRFVTVDTFVHFLGWYQAGRIGRWGERVADAVCVPDRAVSLGKEGEGGRGTGKPAASRVPAGCLAGGWMVRKV